MKRKYRYAWRCECNIGECDFSGKREALRERGSSKFCGRKIKGIRKVRVYETLRATD